MTQIRPAGLIVGLGIILGLVIIVAGVLSTGSDNGEDDTTDELATENVTPTDSDADMPDDVPEDDPPSPDATPDATNGATSDVSDDIDDIDVETDAEADEEVAETDHVTPYREDPLTEEELSEYRPNELGKVLVLMYHRIEQQDNPEDVWTRTPDQFRGDLQWLYDNDFYVIPIRDYIRNQINIPPGKRPVILTFDDGTVGQFRMSEHDGSLMIDPDSAVGILEDFFNRYDDFGRGGLFSILPLAPFAWPDAEDQRDYAGQKLQWLIDNGYELGNHTVGHVNMGETPDDEIKSELARAEILIQEYVPEAEISVLAVPFGVYPNQGETEIFEGWEYQGDEYALEGALMVGAEPAPSPSHVEFDPMWIPRINGDDEQLGRWFSYVEDNPGIIYVSDGNPNTVTIPENLHPSLVDTLDETKIEGKDVIRY